MDETVRKKAREERWARDTDITAVSMRPGRKDREGGGKPGNEGGKAPRKTSCKKAQEPLGQCDTHQPILSQSFICLLYFPGDNVTEQALGFIHVYIPRTEWGPAHSDICPSNI